MKEDKPLFVRLTEALENRPKNRMPRIGDDYILFWQVQTEMRDKCLDKIEGLVAELKKQETDRKEEAENARRKAIAGKEKFIPCYLEGYIKAKEELLEGRNKP